MATFPKNAVQSKDKILELLNGEHTVKSFLNAANLIIDTLTLSFGMWVELQYAYKGREIALRVADDGNRLLINTNHHIQRGNLQFLIAQANVLAQEFGEAQQKGFLGYSATKSCVNIVSASCDPSGTNNPYWNWVD